jgi:hypothetical protein
MMSFWLYINKKPTDKANTLEEAKKMAESYVNDKQPLIIEGLDTQAQKLPMAKNSRWKYDYDKNIWVEELIIITVCGG